MPKFNPQTSKIAITIGQFTLLKSAEVLSTSYNEPYIVTLAVDGAGAAKPAVDFNFMPFPKVREGDTVRMLGDGHLVYGPKNPGEFVAVSILIMESDADVREVGDQLKKFVKSKAVELGLAAVIAAQPGAAAILGILKELTQHIAGMLQENDDDEIFRTEGTFLRDGPVPYHVNREYTRQNEYVNLKLRILPLESGNGQGASVTRIGL